MVGFTERRQGEWLWRRTFASMGITRHKNALGCVVGAKGKMATNNYFKVGKHMFHFFNDENPESIHKAFDKVQKDLRSFPKSRVSVFRQTRNQMTMFLIGESPDISPFEVAAFHQTGWTLKARPLGQATSDFKGEIDAVVEEAG